MTMIETRSWFIPTIGALTGGVLAGDTIVVWSRGARAVARIVGDSVAVFRMDERDPAFAAFVEGEIELLDAANGDLLRVRSNGDLYTIGRLRTDGRSAILSAGRSSTSWSVTRMVDGSQQAGVAEVWSLPATGIEPALFATVPITGEHWVAGSADGRFALLPVRPPYQLTILSPSGMPALIRSVDNALRMNDDAKSESGGWLSTTPVWLGVDDILVTFADMFSDKRIVARFNISSQQLAVRQLQIPMAFMASDPALQRLLAARDLPGSNLALLEWSAAEPMR